LLTVLLRAIVATAQRIEANKKGENVPMSAEALKVLAAARDPSLGPLVVPWPVPGNPAALVPFSSFIEWQAAVESLNFRKMVPQIVTAKFERALKLHLLAWIDFDLIKAGELVALTTLELALTDRYGDKVRDKKGKIYFHRLLNYMPKHDSLTDDKIPMIRRCGGSAVDMLSGKRHPTLAEIRNELAHGYPFDGFPQGGLFELVRDLIEYAYRDWH
jgi:hypothetical protein